MSKVFKWKKQGGKLLGKRIERIYQYIVENTMSGLGKERLSTSEVADHLAIQRSNASKDLNKLVKKAREKATRGLFATGRQGRSQQ